LELLDLKKLGKLEEGEFIHRENRFVGICKVNGKEYRCHISDTGRLKEILTKGRKTLLLKNPKGMKTDYKMVAVEMGEGWVLLNTSVHSRIAQQVIQKGLLGFKPKTLKREVVFQESRLDFLVDGNTYIELKGSNLLKGDTCLFPDAPTIRGRKHLKELIKAVEKGYNAIILMMVLRDCDCFCINREMDMELYRTFKEALEKGVKFIGFKVKINEDKKVVFDSLINLCKQEGR